MPLCYRRGWGVPGELAVALLEVWVPEVEAQSEGVQNYQQDDKDA